MQLYNSCLVWLLAGTLAPVVLAQSDTRNLTAEDHVAMMRQLGISRLRPGPGGNPDNPDFANIDEALANPFPDWPELLTLDNGSLVTTAEQWSELRRPQIVAAFEQEVTGRLPGEVPGVRWSVTATNYATLAGREVTGKHLAGIVDNRSYPGISVELDMSLVLPVGTDGPVPVMVMFGGADLDQALGLAEPARFGPPPTEAERRMQDPSAGEQLIAAGWGFAYLNPTSIQADNGAGLTSGIIGLVNRGEPRKPEDWGALRAWAWGAARALDYLETESGVDASRVGIEGVSRYGKAALVTMAFEPRFAVGFIASSGEGGVSPYRRNFGEMVENLAGQGEYHWMAGNFIKYAAEESQSGSMNAGDLPVDSHMLIALAAPRPLFISYGIPEQGDALWLDQQGSYMATVAAGKVYTLLGESAAGSNENYRTASKPAVNLMLPGRLAWRQHDGGHTAAPNWKYFIPWAKQELDLAEESASEPFPRLDSNSHLAHQALLAKRYAGDIDLYFIGDSITRRWGALDYPELLAHWNTRFRGWNAADFAWGGDRTQNMLWRLTNGELHGIQPKVVVIQAGTNNVGTTAGGPDKVADITAGIAAIVDTVRSLQPQAELVLTAIFPRSDPAVVEEINLINTNLAALAAEREITFLNFNDRLAGPDGLLIPVMGSDGLHLSLDAYSIWAEALDPVLTGFLGPRAETDSAPPPTGNPAAGF
jgi:lysophospholipase L1-like esterase